MASKKKEVEKEVEVEKNSVESESFDVSLDPFVPEPKTDKLTDEQKTHLKFLIDWVLMLQRRSPNVDFRRGAKAAVAELSKLL